MQALLDVLPFFRRRCPPAVTGQHEYVCHEIVQTYPGSSVLSTLRNWWYGMSDEEYRLHMRQGKRRTLTEEEVMDPAEWMARKAREVTGQAAQAAGSQFEHAREAVGDLVEDAEEALKHGYQAVKGTAKQTAQEAVDAIKSTGQKLKENVRGGAEKVKTTADVWQERAKEGVEEVKETAEDLYRRAERGYERASEGAKDMYYDTKGRAEHAYRQAGREFDRYGEEVSRKAGQVWDQVKQPFREEYPPRGYYYPGYEASPRYDRDVWYRPREMGYERQPLAIRGTRYDIPVVAFWSALWVLYGLILYRRVQGLRQRTRVWFGDGSSEYARGLLAARQSNDRGATDYAPLRKAVMSLNNHMVLVPSAAMLFAYLEYHGFPRWALHSMCLLFTSARVGHSETSLHEKQPSDPALLGSLATAVVLGAASLGTLYYSLSGIF